jgi:hypothetical protein
MRLPQKIILWATIGLSIPILIAVAVCMRPDPRAHQRSIVPLTDQVSISDHRDVLDAHWLKQHGFHTLIYLRRDGFFDTSNTKADEQKWITAFAESARDVGLKFFETGGHDRKTFIRNACQLKLAMEDSFPPILIYGDRTRNAGIIWALAEALRPDGLSPDAIVAAASAFELVSPFYRDRISGVFTGSHDKESLPACSALSRTSWRAVANAPNPQKLDPLVNHDFGEAVLLLPTGVNHRVFDALFQITGNCEPCAASVRRQLYGIAVAKDAIAYSGCGRSFKAQHDDCGNDDALAVWDRASNSFYFAVDQHHADGRHGPELQTYPSADQWPTAARRYLDIWTGGQRWPSAN